MPNYGKSKRGQLLMLSTSLKYLRAFIRLSVELGRSPTIREIASSGYADTKHISVIQYSLNKLVDYGFLEKERISKRYSHYKLPGTGEAFRYYITEGGYERTIKSRKLAVLARFTENETSEIIRFQVVGLPAGSNVPLLEVADSAHLSNL